MWQKDNYTFGIHTPILYSFILADGINYDKIPWIKKRKLNEVDRSQILKMKP